MQLAEHLAYLCKEQGIAQGKACEQAGLGKFYLRDLKRKPERSITVDNLKALCAAIGVPVARALEHEAIFGGGLQVDLGGGRTAELTPAKEYGESDKPIRNLLVAATIGTDPIRLFETAVIGRQFMLYPATEIGRTNANAIAYYPSDKWYNGTVEASGTSSMCDIVGVVRRVSTLCNQQAEE